MTSALSRRETGKELTAGPCEDFLYKKPELNRTKLQWQTWLLVFAYIICLSAFYLPSNTHIMVTWNIETQEVAVRVG